MCAEQLPPGGYPIAIKYIKSYTHTHTHTRSNLENTETLVGQKKLKKNRNTTKCRVSSSARVPYVHQLWSSLQPTRKLAQ